jgi:sulfur-carrier protein adenylyltransferase/sulfurtransferase
MAVGLVSLHQALLAFGHPQGLRVTLVDGDRISRVNCVRQPFAENEVGLYKAEVLATRINFFWGLDWKARCEYVDGASSFHAVPQIVISCVDTRKARGEIARSRAFRESTYWLDLGNNADSGQFVLGQLSKPRDGSLRLPTVADLFPEIIDARLDARDKLPSCSALEALESQSPFINQTLAYQALAMLSRLFRYGRLEYHGGFVNLATGRMSPLPVDPTIWKRIKESNPTMRVSRTRRKRSRAA